VWFGLLIINSNSLIVKGSLGSYSDEKLYFLKRFNPLPLNEKFEEEYTFSWFVSKSQLEIEKLDYEITKHNFFYLINTLKWMSISKGSMEKDRKVYF